MKIQPRFTYDSIQFDKDNEIHLVVSLTAPLLSADKKRAPICIIPVIDISGSMAGEKLDYAKQSAMKMVEQLQPGDYGGLASFSDHGRVDYHPVEMTQARKDELRVKIGQLHIEGGTNLCDGMMKAVEAAKRTDLPASVITRVVLLTDGQATHGIAKDAKSLKELLGKIKGHVTLSAFGYGRDPDQALLAGLAQEGAGNYAFIQNPDNALAAFGKELGGLLSTYAQSIEVVINNSNGHIISEVLSDAEVDEEVDGEVTIKIPAILAEETNNIVLAVKLAAQKQHGPRSVNAFDVKVTYECLDDTGTPVKKVEEAKAKIQFVRPEDTQKTPTKEVDEIVARAQLVKAQVAAEKAAEIGDFKTAGAVFNGFAAAAAGRGHHSLVGASRHIGANYADVGTYRRREGNRVALRSATSRGMGTSGLAAEDELALSDASYVVSNSAQEATSQAFTTGSSVLPSPTIDPGAMLSPFALGNQGGNWGGPGPVSGSVVANNLLVMTGNALGASPSLVVPSAVAPEPPKPSASKPSKKLAKTKSKRW